jgi:hypothetical protein
MTMDYKLYYHEDEFYGSMHQDYTLLRKDLVHCPNYALICPHALEIDSKFNNSKFDNIINVLSNAWMERNNNFKIELKCLKKERWTGELTKDDKIMIMFLSEQLTEQILSTFSQWVNEPESFDNCLRNKKIELDLKKAKLELELHRYHLKKDKNPFKP